jgi:drug/metabolite transporter (DMT)-like permease
VDERATGTQARSGGLGAGLIAVCLWGLAPVATRSLVSELAPLPLLTLRQLLAAGVLLPWAVPALRRIDARDLPRLIAAGLLGMVGYNLPVTVGLQWLPASSAGLLLATEPVWVLVIGLVFLAERAGLRIVLGTGVALAGVAVIAGPSALSAGSGTRVAAGAALVLLATLAFGGYTVVLRPLSEKYGPVSATAASSVAGAMPYLALVGTIWPPRLSPPAWGEMLFLALGSTVAGMLLWNRAIVRGGSTRISRLLYLEPVVSVLGAMVFLGERATAAVLAGGVLVIAGVLVTGDSATEGLMAAWRLGIGGQRAVQRDVAEDLVEHGQHVRILDGVVQVAALAPGRNDPGQPQLGQVLAGGGDAEADPPGQRADVGGLVRHQPGQVQPGRAAEQRERRRGRLQLGLGGFGAEA